MAACPRCETAQFLKPATDVGKVGPHFPAGWLTCQKCGYFFLRGPTSLEPVLAGAGRCEKVICQDCGSAYASLDTLVVHANRFHKPSVQRTWQRCPECDLCYPNQSLLLRHTERKHRGKSRTRAPRSLRASHPSAGVQQSAFGNNLPKVVPLARPRARRRRSKTFGGQKAALKERAAEHESNHYAIHCHICSAQFASAEKYHLHAYGAHCNIFSKVWLQTTDSNFWAESQPVPDTPLSNCVGVGSPQPSVESVPSEVDLSEQRALLVLTPAPSAMAPWENDVTGSPVCRPGACHLELADFGTRGAYYRHFNALHRERISRNWRLCRNCIWYFPSAKSLREHKCLYPPEGSAWEVPLLAAKEEPELEWDAVDAVLLEECGSELDSL
jgi:hypothetical protein